MDTSTSWEVWSVGGTGLSKAQNVRLSPHAAFPGFYLLSEKIGMTLEQAHEPVPYFNEKLLKSVERTLKRFAPNEPFERTSWGKGCSLFRHTLDHSANLSLSLVQKSWMIGRCTGITSRPYRKVVAYPTIWSRKTTYSEWTSKLSESFREPRLSFLASIPLCAGWNSSPTRP